MRSRGAALALALAIGGLGCELSESPTQTASAPSAAAPTSAANPAAPGQQVLVLHVDGL